MKSQYSIWVSGLILASAATVFAQANSSSPNSLHSPVQQQQRRVANPLRNGNESQLETQNPVLVSAAQESRGITQNNPTQNNIAQMGGQPMEQAQITPVAGEAFPSFGELSTPPTFGGGGFLEDAGFGNFDTNKTEPEKNVALATVPAAPVLTATPLPVELPTATSVTPTNSAAPATLPAAIPTTIPDNATFAPVPMRRGAEGNQTPQLFIEKKYPEEITLGAVTSLGIVLKNTGSTSVRDVVLRDQLPQGVRLVETNPPATTGHTSEVVWSFAEIPAGAQVAVEMKVVPSREGEMSTVAAVTFTSDTSARTLVTRPQLQVEVKSPPGIMIGDAVSLDFVVSNPGTGTARGVILENHVPHGLRFTDERGNVIELLRNEIGDIKPQQSVTLTLPPLKCVDAGEIVNRLVVRAEGGLTAEARTPISVLAPKLQLAINGAKNRFLERQAIYKLAVSNPGTASAKNVDLVCQLPAGFQFVSTDQSGVYEPTSHTVHWALEELPAGEGGEITLTLVPVRIGEQFFRFRGTGHNQLSGEATLQAQVDGMAATSFSVNCVTDMIEVGREAIYEIKVTNRGTKPSSSVGIAVQLSKGMELVKADGPVQYAANYGVLQFDALGQLDPKQERVYRVAARCLADGDHRISVRLTADDLQAPLVKEENTRVLSGN